MNRSLPLILICALLLTACSSAEGGTTSCDHNLPERYVWQLPTYPGTQPNQESLSSRGGKLTFKTEDAPATVMAFYEQELKKESWQVQTMPTPVPNERIFGTANCCYYGSVSVNAEAKESSQTTVTVTVFWSQGCG